MIELTVIIPCYNSAQTLARSVRSALVQSCSKEIIIINDCSTDDSLSVALDLQNNNDCVTVVSSPKNIGPGACRNIGLSRARGIYIAFLDADDWWLVNKARLQIDFMISRGFDFSYHDYYSISFRDGAAISAVMISAPETAELPNFFYKRGYGMCLTSMLSRSAVAGARFSEDRSISVEDYHFFLEFLSLGNTGHRLPLPLGVYVTQANSRSRNKIRQAISVLRTNLLLSGKNKISAIWFFLVYIFHQTAIRYKGDIVTGECFEKILKELD